MVELQNGKKSNKYDEIELYHIERVGEDRWETLNFRIHQSWNNINLVAINTRVNTNGEVPSGTVELKHGPEWNPGEFYNSKSLTGKRWDVVKQEYLQDGSLFGARKYIIDADKTFTTQIGECTRYQELRSDISVWYTTLKRNLTFDEKLGYASGMWSKQDSKLGMMIPDFSKKPTQVDMTIYVNKESTSAEKRFALYKDIPTV